MRVLKEDFATAKKGDFMAAHVIDIRCPGCNAPVTTGMKECEYCGSPVVISTFNSVMDIPGPKLRQYTRSYQEDLRNNPDNPELNSSIGMIYLKLKLYDKALEAFEKAIEDDFDNSETYFYAAVCLLAGKKPFLHLRPTINKIVDYVNAANMIEPRGIYYYFLAYIKQDYHARKFLSITPNYKAELAEAQALGVSDIDIDMVFSACNLPKPVL